MKLILHLLHTSFKHFRGLTEGTKEIKIHRLRREAFVHEQLQPAAEDARRYVVAGLTTYAVARLGAGKFLPPRRWEADSVTAALGKLLDQPTVQARCQELVRRIHQHDGLGAVSDVIESL